VVKELIKVQDLTESHGVKYLKNSSVSCQHWN